MCLIQQWLYLRKNSLSLSTHTTKLNVPNIFASVMRSLPNRRILHIFLFTADIFLWQCIISFIFGTQHEYWTVKREASVVQLTFSILMHFLLSFFSLSLNWDLPVQISFCLLYCMNKRYNFNLMGFQNKRKKLCHIHE